jgi:type 1 fimbriae regulatory protein FimB
MRGISTRPERSRDYLTKEEMDKLLAAAKSPGASRNPIRNYAILLLMFRHGLRVTELCRLRLSDVDLPAKILHVNREKGCDSGPHELLNGEVPAVKAWLTDRADMLKRKPDVACDTVFISEELKPLHRCTVWLMITKIAQAAGFYDLAVHSHTMRHSTGYAMINNGNELRVIQEYLGHRDIASTVRYTKLNKNRFKGLV